MPRRNANPGQSEAAAERREQAFRLRKDGKSYRFIGQKLGVSGAQAFRYVHEVLKDLAQKTEKAARELRQLEGERLDYLWAKLLPKVREGDASAIQAAVRVVQRRCSLFGLDGPRQVEHTGKGGGPMEHEQTVFYIPQNDRDPPPAGAAGAVPGQPG